MIKKWSIIEPEDGKIEHAVIALAGRMIKASAMMELLNDMELPNTLMVAIQPYHLAWYPQPISSINQKEALSGIPKARKACQTAIDRISNSYNLPYNKIGLLGFSAGGVMTIETISRLKTPLAFGISLCGSILEPSDLPLAQKESTPLLLVHNKNDQCFDWYERHLPTKSALIDKGYNVVVREKRYGGHMIDMGDIIAASEFGAKSLGISKWSHPIRKKLKKSHTTGQAPWLGTTS